MERRATRRMVRLDTLADALTAAAVLWLLAVGVWSGPAYGASLTYPTGVLWVEAGLAGLLLDRWRATGRYPFLWPGLGVLALATLAAWLRPGPVDLPAVWRHGEPMLRGLLVFLALLDRPKLHRAAWAALLAGAALLALAAVVQHLQGVTRWFPVLAEGWQGGWHPVPGTRAQGLTSYINLTAAVLAAALPLWYLPPLWREPPARWARLALVAGAVLAGAALWYTASRGPLLALAPVSVVALWRQSPRWGTCALALLAGLLAVVLPAWAPWALAALLLGVLLILVTRRRGLAWLTAFALGLAVAGGLLAVDAYVLHRPISWRVSEEGMGDVARVALFADTARVAAAAPWWGIGDAAVAARFSAMPSPILRGLDASRRNAHNQYLHWAAAEGLPVALAATALVCWVAGWLWRRARQDARPVPLAAAMGLTIFLLANLVDAHFWRIEGAGFFWTTAGLAAALLCEPSAEP